jgi:hypothetical protein
VRRTAAILAVALAFPLASPATISANECRSSVGPGIPPPASVAVGIEGFHAAWHGQSGQATLCPGDTTLATVAFLNTGTRGWVRGLAGETALLGTWGPDPGQDRSSALGGDGTHGGPDTGWPRYDRVAIQPSDYVGPGQVAWFQFTVRAPSRAGTYRLDVRPLIEGTTWMEDFAVSWYLTVLDPLSQDPIATPKPFAPVAAPPPPPACRDALVWTDIAVNAIYQTLVKITTGDLVANVNTINAMRQARHYERARSGCRAWALPNGGLTPGSHATYTCVTALQAFDDYALRAEEQAEILGRWGGPPPAELIDRASLRSLGQTATQHLKAWLALSPQCLSAVSPPNPSPTPPPGIIAVSGPTGPIAAGRITRYSAEVWNTSDQRISVPIVWSISDPRLGTIDNTGSLETGTIAACGQVIAQAAGISASVDVCVSFGDAVNAGTPTSR